MKADAIYMVVVNMEQGLNDVVELLPALYLAGPGFKSRHRRSDVVI
jgi:hypothetical protein